MANTTEVKLINQPIAKLENTTNPLPTPCKLVILDLSSSGTRVCINVPLVVLNAAWKNAIAAITTKATGTQGDWAKIITVIELHITETKATLPFLNMNPKEEIVKAAINPPNPVIASK